MIKSELIEQMQQLWPELTQDEVAKSVSLILSTMSDSLADGRRIEIRDFGCWFAQFRESRMAHNPRTGNKVKTAPKYLPRFKPGKALRERVDANKHLPIKDALDEDNDGF